MRRREKGRIGIGMALVCLLCLVVFVFGTEAVWGSESADATTSIPPSKVIKRPVGDPSERWITEQRMEMLVEKDFWTHRLEGLRPYAGDFWIVETPFPNQIAFGDFLNFTVIAYNGSSDSPIDFSYELNMREHAQGGLNQEG